MRFRDAMIGISAGLAVVGSAHPGLTYQEGNVSGGGTIKGKIVYAGDVPTRTVVPTKDQQVRGGGREEAGMKVGADFGVGIVYPKEVG